ncbi:phosphoesterase PA-phosphatase [Phytohabitans sp. LJ34]|uniref:phosphoesterase PA-phosphatase n=1 Tax=Phytohabitans sp. LJ34 TaxID=3452217 RepID=UPI003F8A28E9
MTADGVTVGADHRFARTVTEAFAPAVLAAAMVVGFALSSADSLRAGVLWALLTALFTAAVPYAIVRAGGRGFLPLGLASCLAGIGALAALGAPRPLTAVVVVLLTTGVVVTAVNRAWRLSAHAAVAAASAETLVIAFGQWMTPLFVVVALVAWSRVRLGDHSPAQVVTGAIAGVVLAPPVYVLVA